MRLSYNGLDISRLLSRAVWSGDIGQAPRALEVTLLWSDEDPDYPRGIVGNIQCGDKMALFADSGQMIFSGRVFAPSRTLGETTRTYRLLDNAAYVSKSEITANFHKKTPEEVARQACSLAGQSAGTLASGGGLELSFVHIGKTAYDAIMGAYTQVAQMTGKEYFVRDENGLICVREIGEIMASRTLTSSTDIVKASYTSTLDSAVTQVVVATSKGEVIDTVTGEVAQYGLIQKVISPEKGEDPAAKAAELLKGPEHEAALAEILGGGDALDLITGNTVAVHEPVTGIYGVFYIASDTHTFENSQHKISLGLAFELSMTKTEIDQKKSGAAKPATNPLSGWSEIGKTL